MKFTALFALLGFAAAASDVQTMAMRDQMKSLQNLVTIAQTRKAGDMLNAINDRKAELEYQVALQGPNADKKMVTRELQYLLALVQNIEQNDYAAATRTMAHRKNKLMKMSMHLDAPRHSALSLADEGGDTPAVPTKEELEQVVADTKALQADAETALNTAKEAQTAADEALAADPEN